MKFKSWKLVMFGVFLVHANHSRAADITWTNASGGNWSSAGNWNPNQIPGLGDNAFITNNGSYTVAVTISADANANSVMLGGTSGTQTLAVSGGTFTLAAASSVGSQGSLTFSGGTL